MKCLFPPVAATGFALLTCLCVPGVVLAQPVAEVVAQPSRPKIGIALGGGSARGVAHVGVLRWMEEHRIPVDVVAGSSIGAFIGGAYATGMSAPQIQSMLTAEDWERTLQPDLPYSVKSYRRKEDDAAYAVKLDLGLRHGLEIQSGLNSGHRLGLLLSRVTLPFSTVDRFDDLAIPFRAVATDLETGESVALDHGPLNLALRASMALPGTFEPVVFDGRMLADGGILNNVPVDVAKAMGATVVIAVNVSSPQKDRPVNSIQAVANRAIRLMMEDLDKPRLAAADVVIVPDVESFGAAAFSQSNELEARGYEAAEAHASELLRYALSEPDWADYQARIRKRRKPHTGPVSFVEVMGVSEAAARQISQRLSEDLAKASDPAVIEPNLDWVIGYGRYASASYHRTQRGSTEGLTVDVTDKSYAPPLVALGLDLDNENKDINLTFGARVTFMDVTSLGSELRVDASVGSTMKFSAELLQPLGGTGSMRRGAFVAPRVSYSRVNENLYVDNDDLVAIYNRERVGGGLDAGWLFGRKAQLRVGYDAAYVKNHTRLGELSPSNEGPERSFHGRIDYDGRNRAYFATSGTHVSASTTWFMKLPGAPQEFGKAQATLSRAFRFGQRQHVTLHLDGGTSFGDEPPPPLYQFTLGGPFRLGSFAPGSLRGDRFLLGGVTFRSQLRRLPRLLGDRLYLTGVVEMGSAFDRMGSAVFKTSFTAGISADTFFGPFFLGASDGRSGDLRIYFVLGSGIR
ncbi:MAG: patatin-like phospholipase family protein [Vicinamibacteria bacterium]